MTSPELETSGNAAPDADSPPLRQAIGAPDPLTGMPMGVPPMSGGIRARNFGNDPDAHGLPPDVIMPEANAFKRDQLRARLLVSLVALAVLGIIVWASDEHRLTYGLCTAGVGLAVAVLGVRYALARHKAAKIASLPPSGKTS